MHACSGIIPILFVREIEEQIVPATAGILDANGKAIAEAIAAIDNAIQRDSINSLAMSGAPDDRMLGDPDLGAIECRGEPATNAGGYGSAEDDLVVDEVMNLVPIEMQVGREPGGLSGDFGNTDIGQVLLPHIGAQQAGPTPRRPAKADGERANHLSILEPDGEAGWLQATCMLNGAAGNTGEWQCEPGGRAFTHNQMSISEVKGCAGQQVLPAQATRETASDIDLGDQDVASTICLPGARDSCMPAGHSNRQHRSN